MEPRANSCSRLMLTLRGWHQFLHPFLHLLRGHVFHVRSDAPEMSEWVLQEAGAISVELVLHRFQYLSAFGDGAVEDLVNVRKVDIEADRTRANGGGAGVSLAHAGIF